MEWYNAAILVVFSQLCEMRDLNIQIIFSVNLVILFELESVEILCYATG